MVSVGNGGYLRSWNLKNYKQLAKVDLKSGPLTAVAISNDGMFLCVLGVRTLFAQ